MDNETPNCAPDFKGSDLKLKGFRVYEIIGNAAAVPTYNRRDFYKIAINTGKNAIHYADRGIETDGTILFFGNPRIPYSWETLSPDYNGFACVFTEDFFKTAERSECLNESPLFKPGGTPIFSLSEEQRYFIDSMFKRMIAEQDSDYVFKDDLIRNCLMLIIHEALKMQPSESFFKHKNASSRITTLFLELLERQFPIETKERPLKLKTPQDFAQNLAIHVNHLNRSVKEITGRSTSSHIAERVIGESKALLQHTDWSIADIAYSLGFEYPSYFNNYFKRLTGTIPKTIRL